MKRFNLSRFTWLLAALALALSAPVGTLDAKPSRGKKAHATKVSGKGQKGNVRKASAPRGGSRPKSGLIASRAGHGKKPTAHRSAPTKRLAAMAPRKSAPSGSRIARPPGREQMVRRAAPRPIARHAPDRIRRAIPYGPIFWPFYGLSTYVETAAPVYYDTGGYPLATRIAVQSELARLGYYVGRIDGIIGPMSRAAIAHYQSDHGLAVTGSINGVLLESLGLL